MARSFSSIFLAIVFLAGSFHAASAAPALIPSFEQRRAIQALFSYSFMQNNPVYAESDLQSKLNQESIQKVLSKTGENMTPFEQIKLISDTFYLNFADGFLAETTLAVATSWGISGFLEAAWRVYCQGMVNVQTVYSIPAISFAAASNGRSDAFSKTSTAGTDTKSSQDASSAVRVPFDYDALKRGLKSEYESIACSDSVRFIFDRYSFLSAVFPQYTNTLQALRVQRQQAFYSGLNLLVESFYPEQQGSVAPNIQQLEFSTALQYGQGGKKPAWLSKTIVGLSMFIKAYPALRRVFRYIKRQRTISRGAAVENFFENLCKTLTPSLAAACSDKAVARFLISYLINPLWQKHNGAGEKVCAELALMGEQVRLLESSIDSNEPQSLSRFVMGLHGSGLPTMKPMQMDVLRRAFEKHMLKRIVLSAGGAMAIPVALMLYHGFAEPQLLGLMRKLSTNIFPPIFCFFWACASMHACAKGLMNRDDRQAREDYKVFLKRRSLEASRHAEHFYWSWFLPFWRLSNKDILAVEKLFVARVEEVEATYKAAHA